MQRFISDFCDESALKIITPDDGYHYFFGYYDMRATGKNGKHLAHRVAFMDRLPTADDIAELGYLENGKFVKFAETTAWNFQQGAMLQYHPFLENTVYYNVCENGQFRGVTHNFVTGEKKYADRATACVSPDGKWGLSINFGRVFSFRAGYGYAGFIDENANVNAPANDGVYLVNMESGKSKLLISYSDLLPKSGYLAEDKIVVNHLTFNPTSKKFNMLVRRFPTSQKFWSTALVVGDLDGNVYEVLPDGYYSHYWWTGENTLLAYCSVNGDKTRNLYEVNVIDRSYQMYDMPYLHGTGNRDVHCSLSADATYLLGDGYPLGNPPYQYQMLRNQRTSEEVCLFQIASAPNAVGDIRCDLHTRHIWNGTHISFDTTLHGKRQIAVLPVDIFQKKIRFNKWQ